MAEFQVRWKVPSEHEDEEWFEPGFRKRAEIRLMRTPVLQARDVTKRVTWRLQATRAEERGQLHSLARAMLAITKEKTGPPVMPLELGIKLPEVPGLTGQDTRVRSTGKGYFGQTEKVETDFGKLEEEFRKYNIRPKISDDIPPVLSQRSCRFELPSDMKALETMSTHQYLTEFCVVRSERLNLYMKFFNKHKTKAGHLTGATLRTVLKDMMAYFFRENTMADLCEILEIKNETIIDFRLFCGFSALKERVQFPYMASDMAKTSAEYQRDAVEKLDFSALDRKLVGINVSDRMRKLLKLIQ